MPKKAAKATTALEDDADIPAWKRASVERSLTAARVRAQERSDRFVASALELMNERGNTEFTVQEVVENAKMSIRTFYNFFQSKDDLLIAVHETILADEVVTRLRKRCDAKKDPVEKIRAYIEGLFELSEMSGPAARALTTYRNQLAETRPDDLELAFKPQVDLVTELVEQAAQAGRLRPGLSIEAEGRLLHLTVLAAVHARILGTGTGFEPEDVWNFCAFGLGVKPARKA